MTNVLDVKLEYDANLHYWVWTGEPFNKPMLLTADFGEPRDNGVGFHTGMDLAPLDGQPGTEIGFQNFGAFIEWCGVYNGSRARDLNGGYGNVLDLIIGIGGRCDWKVRIAHMQGFCPAIQSWLDSGYQPQQKPTFGPGEGLGWQGNTGYVYGTLPDGSFGIPAGDDMVSGTHTHLEVRTLSGLLVNPRVALGMTEGRTSGLVY